MVNVRPGPFVFEQPEGVERIELTIMLQNGASRGFEFAGPFEPVHRLGELFVGEVEERSVRLRVVDASDERPLSGALARFAMKTFGPSGPDGLLDLAIPTQRHKEAGGLVFGAHRIAVGAPGYEIRMIDIPVGDSLEILLEPSTDLQVVVRDGAGRVPREGVRIRIRPNPVDLETFHFQFLAGGDRLGLSGSAAAVLIERPDDGDTTLHTVVSGRIRLDLVDPFEEPLCDPVTVDLERGRLHEVELVQSDPAKHVLEIRVVDGAGRPLTGARAHVEAGTRRRRITEFTDASGRASIWTGATDLVDLRISADGFGEIRREGIVVAPETIEFALSRD